MAKRKYEVPVKWRPMKTAPRDGTPVELLADGDHYPFFGYWGNVTRFVTGNKGWLGHEDGMHRDQDLVGWRPTHVRRNATMEAA